MQNKVVSLLETMEEVLTITAYDALKHADGNKSAGTRVRKAMQRVKGLAQEVRVTIQEQKNSVAV